MYVRLAASLVILSVDPNCGHGRRHCLESLVKPGCVGEARAGWLLDLDEWSFHLGEWPHNWDSPGCSTLRARMASSLCNKRCVVSSTLRRRQALHPSSQPYSHSLPPSAKPSHSALAFPNSALQGLRIAFTPTRLRVSNPSPTYAAPVSAKLVRFTGRKEVSIPFQENSLPPGEYLKQTERIVNVTFPDSARIKYLGDQVWQARLLTITFFQFSATPFTDVRVVHENGVLIIDSTRLILDVTGLPEQFRNMDLQFTLHGELRVFPRTNGSPSRARKTWDFGGWVNIGVGANLPIPLSLIPERLLTGVGNQVVERILGAMEGALLQGIIDDYNAWCASANPQAVPVSGKQ